MKVIQSLNQNAVLVARDDGAELVALGRGVGFGKKKGDTIDPAAVTRVFSLASSYRQEQLLGLIKELEPWVFELAQDITIIAEACLKQSLMDTFIFTIAKHLQYALDREPIEGGDYDPFSISSIIFIRTSIRRRPRPLPRSMPSINFDWPRKRFPS